MILRVMSYNIGHYNMGLSEGGFPDSLYTEKLGNLKQMLMETGPDVIGIQEDTHYVDRAGTKKSPATVYSPVWSFRNGYKYETIRAKFKIVSGSYELVNFSNGQHYRKGTFTIGGKGVLVVSAHMIAHTGNAEKRKVQYTELFRAISSAEACIVTGDFNTTEKADKATLTALCEKNGFTMAIGSYLPWVDTFFGRAEGATPHSFDNILVKGMTIKTTKVLRDWYERLYSDHVPVIADIEMP